MSVSPRGERESNGRKAEATGLTTEDEKEKRTASN